MLDSNSNESLVMGALQKENYIDIHDVCMKSLNDSDIKLLKEKSSVSINSIESP